MKIILFLSLPFLILTLGACGRPAGENANQSSLGAALESSFTQSAGEEKARSPARERQQQIRDWQARQKQLQQERLQSYDRNPDSFPQNP
jgi:hypothetical protein